MTASLSLRLRTVPGRYAVAQLPADAPFPAWADGPGLCALVRASDELSVVCLQERVPSDVRAERDHIRVFLRRAQQSFAIPVARQSLRAVLQVKR